MTEQWSTARFGTALKRGQTVRAALCAFNESHQTVVEGTVIEDTDGMFEVFEIMVGDKPTMVFYPSEIQE